MQNADSVWRLYYIEYWLREASLYIKVCSSHMQLFSSSVIDCGEHGCRLLFLGEEKLPDERELTPLCKVHNLVPIYNVLS